MGSDATVIAAIHRLPHGRWCAFISHPHARDFVDLQAADARPEVVAWLDRHYPGIYVAPCECERNSQLEDAKERARAH